MSAWAEFSSGEICFFSLSCGRIQFLVVVGLVELLVSLPTVSHRPLLAPSVRLDFLTCGLLSLNPAMAHQILTVFQMSDFCHQLEKTVLLKGLCG